MFRKMIAVAFSLLSLTVLTASTAMADGGLVFGAGFAIHTFAEEDDFRKGTGLFSGADELKAAGGLQGYAEYFLTPGFGFGVKYQGLSGSVTYTGFTYELERKVSLTNIIGYGNFSIGLGNEEYARLGVIAGMGTSTYQYEITCTEKSSNSCSSFTNYSESASGTITQAGVYLDWGAEEFGGRLGYNSVAANYDDINNSTPKGNGGQGYLDIRYAF